MGLRRTLLTQHFSSLGTPYVLVSVSHFACLLRHASAQPGTTGPRLARARASSKQTHRRRAARRQELGTGSIATQRCYRRQGRLLPCTNQAAQRAAIPSRRARNLAFQALLWYLCDGHLLQLARTAIDRIGKTSAGFQGLRKCYLGPLWREQAG